MIYGSTGETEGKWFTLRGTRRRLLGRFPTVSEWEAYLAAGSALNADQPKPLEPVKRDVVGFYRVARENVGPLLTGIEIDGDARDVDDTSWREAVLGGGIYQNALANFAGWLFCDAAEFCDDGPAKDEGSEGV